MKNSTRLLIILGVTAIVIVALIFGVRSNNQKPGPYDELAQHISDSGAVFYGAYWCQFCSEQKAIFGRSARLLNYVECAVPGRPNGEQTQACVDADITSYPTWDFPDQERATGVLSLEELSQRTGFTTSSNSTSSDVVID